MTPKQRFVLVALVGHGAGWVLVLATLAKMGAFQTVQLFDRLGPSTLNALQLGGSSLMLMAACTMLSEPIMGLIRGMRQRFRSSEGRCPACGYDLRATPLRCPECGWRLESAHHG